MNTHWRDLRTMKEAIRRLRDTETFRGFVGGKPVASFGEDEAAAYEWLETQTSRTACVCVEKRTSGATFTQWSCCAIVANGKLLPDNPRKVDHEK